MSLGLMRAFRGLFAPFHGDEAYYRLFDNITSLNLDEVGIFRLLKAWVGRPAGGALDLGCGLGYVTAYLDAEGLDNNPHAIDRARKLFPKTRFKVASAACLRPGHRYGALVCVNIVEHLEDLERRLFFERLPKLLRPGGAVYFVYDNMYHPLQVLSALRAPGTLLLDPTHVHCWTVGQFRRLLAGRFDVTREIGGNIQSRTLPWGNRFKTARLFECRLRRRLKGGA